MSKEKNNKISLTAEEQLFAAEKVQEEMKIAEEYFQAANIHLQEHFLDAYSLSLAKLPPEEVGEIEKQSKRQFHLANIYHPKKRIGEPLRKVAIRDKHGTTHTVEFGRIEWTENDQKGANRSFIFLNDGNIKYSKEARTRRTNKSGVTYDTKFNVLSPDFQIVIMLDQEILGPDEKYQCDYYWLTLEGNELTERWNDIEIKRDLYKRTKKSTIKKDKIDAVEEIILDKINSIKGEIPLRGLVNRLDTCIEQIRKQEEDVKNQKSYKKNKKHEKPNNGGGK